MTESTAEPSSAPDPSTQSNASDALINSISFSQETTVSPRAINAWARDISKRLYITAGRYSGSREDTDERDISDTVAPFLSQVYAIDVLSRRRATMNVATKTKDSKSKDKNKSSKSGDEGFSKSSAAFELGTAAMKDFVPDFSGAEIVQVAIQEIWTLTQPTISSKTTKAFNKVKQVMHLSRHKNAAANVLLQGISDVDYDKPFNDRSLLERFEAVQKHLSRANLQLRRNGLCNGIVEMDRPPSPGKG